MIYFHPASFFKVKSFVQSSTAVFLSTNHKAWKKSNAPILAQNKNLLLLILLSVYEISIPFKSKFKFSDFEFFWKKLFLLTSGIVSTSLLYKIYIPATLPAIEANFTPITLRTATIQKRPGVSLNLWSEPFAGIHFSVTSISYRFLLF